MTKKFLMNIDEKLLDKSKELAKKKGITLAGMIRQYLSNELEREEEKSRNIKSN